MSNKKELWEIYPDVWKTKSEFFTWLRGGLRNAVWSKYPPKLIFKNKNCSKPPTGLPTRAKSGTYCALSGDWTGKSNLDVDHTVGNVSLRDWDDLLTFVKHLCTTEDNMQLVSKEAHKVKSYSERMGISYEEAVIMKKVIAFEKKGVDVVKKLLHNNGYSSSSYQNAKTRRESLVEYLTKESTNGTV